MKKKRFTLFKRILKGQFHFSKEFFGKTLTMDDGKKFCVIRDVRIDFNKNHNQTLAVFIVRFKFSGLPLAVNKRMSIFPTPFLMAKSGFLEKIWTVSDDGYFQGIYQWDSKESAESYHQSFIFKMMTKRSKEGTLSYEVIPDMELSEYIDNFILNQ
jgi:hypothetical protein